MIKLKDQFKNIELQISRLPNKLNFKISEIAQIIGVANHVLRYWEKEFSILNPEKFTNKQRIYSKKDIQILLLIKYLLYKEKFSIEGLRKHLPSYFQQLKQYKIEKKETQMHSLHIEKKVHQLLNSISQMRSITQYTDSV